MGLCKCRTVTTLFCFEHRKNVCEQCVISEHPTCVVRTYLQWLQDSDFDPNCTLCHEPFGGAAGDVNRPYIRLACFDLFHFDCLERELLKISTDDGEIPALARTKCPLCRTPLLPVAHEVTPLYTQIRTVIAQHSKTFASQLASIPSAGQEIEKARAAAAADAARGTALATTIHNAAQPNGLTEMITIDMGPRAQYMEMGSRKQPPPQLNHQKHQPDDPKIHGPPPTRTRHLTSLIDGLDRPSLGQSLRSILRVLLNCLTLRNVRVLSLGVSPRQTMLIAIILIATLIIALQFVLPALNVSSPI